MKILKLLILLAFAPIVGAQNTSAKLENVAANGLHRIFLPAEIRSASQLNLSDFRILDANGNQVPYQIPSGSYDGVHAQFKPFKILSRETIPNKKTSIVVENQKAETTDITLQIANAEVTKKFSISGSNDLKEWFGLVNQRELSEIMNESSTNEFKIIFLPRNSYKYIRFDIDDKKTLPLNILAAGDVVSETLKKRTAEITPSKIEFEEIKERKVTRIHVQFPTTQLVTHFEFDITAPNHFNRNVRQFKLVEYRYKKKDGVREKSIDNFNLASGQMNIVHLPFFEKDFYFEIDNRDNPKLTVPKITFYQNLLWVVADLKAGEKYTVETGNPKASAPDYDMDLREDLLHGNLPEATIADVKHVSPGTKKTTESEKSVWQKPWFLWLCIAIGAAVIAYFTLSLVKDMKRE